ncbi:hypothetical protein LCGC14_0824590 [marine sediment metagenome]|uniref:Calcineurin-like phosphoesterase domain-containing protein n=1 Tax=marine sediment metagenome TaxID=412755 RepID=A0A0F9PMI2_9ZZZZ
MNTKFLHIADVHLGKRQYNNNERYQDYFKAFKWILELAIQEGVDFVLIAGDLFDNRQVSPYVLTEVFYLIRNFKTKSQKALNHEIPLICIEGNHDNPIYSRQSWMTFLADLDLIILLSGEYDKYKKTISFDPYDPKTRRGGMIQINNVNIYGVSFYGSSTVHLFQPIVEAITVDSSKLNVLMMHFGVDGQDQSKPGIKLSDPFNNLHSKVDYLALGHYHKLYQLPRMDPWIHNPGALEITDIKEVFEYFDNDAKRGAFLISSDDKTHQTKALICENGATDPNLIPNRKFMRVSSIDIRETTSFDESIALVLDKIKRWGTPTKNSSMASEPNDLNCPILFFNLEGQINYSRLDVNINQLRHEIMENFALLEVRIFSPFLVSSLDDIKVPQGKKTIEEIEFEVFTAMVKENSMFEHVKEEVVELMKNLKAELLVGKPNYPALKDFIKEWCLHNAKEFKIQENLPKPEPEPDEIPEVEEAIEADDEIDLDLDDYIDNIEDTEAAE